VYHVLLEMNRRIHESTQPLYTRKERQYNRDVGAGQALYA